MRKLVIFLTFLLSSLCYGIGGQIYDGNDPYEIVTPYDSNDLFELQYVQSADQMYIVHNNYPPYILSRISDSNWNLTALDFQGGPFLDENEDENITITPSGTTTDHYYDYYITGDDSQAIVRGAVWACQTFKASSAYDVNGVKLRLWRTGEPGTLTVGLRATSGGSPTGADLASGTTNANTLTTSISGVWRDINFSVPYTVVSGTTYAIIVRATSGDTSNSVYWRHDSTSPTYSGGSYGGSTNSGSSWTMYSTADFMFEVIADTNDVNAVDITLEATGDIFDANHVGALWQISHILDASVVSGTFWTNGDSNSATVAVQEGRAYAITTSGGWWGTFKIQRSYDDGVTWRTVESYTFSGDGNIQYSNREVVDDAIYRVRMENQTVSSHQFRHNEGFCRYNLSASVFTNRGIVKITAVTDANTAMATVIETLGSTDATFYWAEGAWSLYRGYPSCIAFYEERLILAATTYQPQTLWFSATDDWDNFEEGVETTDAFGRTIASDQVNVIRWMTPQSVLIVGTSGAEWKIEPSKAGIPFSPTNCQATRQSTYGSALMQAMATDNQVLYLQRQRRKIRQIRYSYEQNSWISPDITLYAEHITESGIKDWAYQRAPYPILWCVRNDGKIAALTMDDNEQVIGWHLHTTDGEFESVAVIPDVNEDRPWFIVKRTIDGNDVRYIEQLQPFNWGTDQKNCFFVDSGLTFDGGAAVVISDVTQADPAVVTAVAHGFSDGDQIRITDIEGMIELNNKVWSVGTVANVNTFELRDSTDAVDINSVDFTAYVSDGSAEQVENTFVTLDHLEGETVYILGDGGYYGAEIVDANTITLSDYFNKVHAGLYYAAKLRPMKLESASAPGALFGTNMRVTEITLRLYNTLGCDIGTSWTKYDPLIFRDADDLLETATPLYTGDKRISFDSGYVRAGEVYIQNRIPLPITVLAMKAKYEAYK